MPFNVDSCPRKLSNCEVLSNILSDSEGDDRSFVCVGYNQPADRKFQQDIFRHCWFAANGTQIDIMQDMDRRDMIDTVSILSQALSIDANIEESKQNPSNEAQIGGLNVPDPQESINPV